MSVLEGDTTLLQTLPTWLMPFGSESMDGIWSFLTIIATLFVAVIPVTWAWHYDRYRRQLEAHESWVSWITALRSEVDHELASLKEMKNGFESMKQQNRLGAVTTRFNEDFFQIARANVINHVRSPHVFPPLTKAYRDTAHTNGMLDRFETQILTHQTTLDDQIPNAIQGMIPSILASFKGVESSLEDLKKDLAEEEVLFAAICPQLFGFLGFGDQDCACGNTKTEQ